MSFPPTISSSALPEGSYNPNCPLSFAQSQSGISDIKPFSLPSLASITSNLATRSPSAEQSLTGPHRKSCSFSISGRRRFSPLGTSMDFGDPVSPLESELSAEGRSSASGISMIAAGHRPRSHSLLSGYSVVGNLAEPDAPADESASDSGGSDKKNEDNESSALSKKRSRTLTTPSQQRRLMQILEQTRFPSTDVREQLARELGMTPRRVQIWFQNRRQGMKKALEQKTEQETSGASKTEFPRSRGYSFGLPADTYAQSGLHSLPEGKIATAASHGQNTGSGEARHTSHSIDGLQQLYSSRSVSRGMPHGLTHLELSNNCTAASNNDPSGGSVGDYIWTDPSTASSLYSIPSATGGDASFSPFAKQDHHYSNSDLTRHEPTAAGNRHRSQTNPDFFGIINGLMDLPGLGRTSQESMDSFQHMPDGNAQQMAMNSRDQFSGTTDGWSSSYIQSAPAWQEGLDNLKIDRHGYGIDRSIYPSAAGPDPTFSNSTCKVVDPSNGYYYSGGNSGTFGNDGLGTTSLLLNREGEYVSNLEHDTLEPDLAQHLRNRSQSLQY
ncbi:hypothetical protein, variant [Puccinia triticina 1-1 BBBD Race 1]|uniref:Homeobox domain-containing protein n=1 Tax=Puccinia triticina (isolate 1-1 / race 1 (BBBD)) TaxID=630390 RepID=A0A180G6M7_PUCT1|nr:hypothetical protein PTTG_01977 [Puccinia triticina 1-1 BBBD Race 1]OAV88346.1 hypothetical protein, variant [Puccinia triticina 1-1 BBBD Race 1]